MNQCNFIGRLTRDPETRYAQSGTAFTSFSLAIDMGKDKNGGKQTEFADFSAAGKTAELIAQYCQKGKMVRITGQYQRRKYQDREGNDRMAHGFFVRDIEFLSGNASGSGSSGAQNNGEQNSGADDSDLPF